MELETSIYTIIGLLVLIAALFAYTLYLKIKQDKISTAGVLGDHWAKISPIVLLISGTFAGLDFFLFDITNSDVIITVECISVFITALEKLLDVYKNIKIKKAGILSLFLLASLVGSAQISLENQIIKSELGDVSTSGVTDDFRFGIQSTLAFLGKEIFKTIRPTIGDWISGRTKRDQKEEMIGEIFLPLIESGELGGCVEYSDLITE